jgi:hypothetical protein
MPYAGTEQVGGKNRIPHVSKHARAFDLVISQPVPVMDKQYQRGLGRRADEIPFKRLSINFVGYCSPVSTVCC